MPKELLRSLHFSVEDATSTYEGRICSQIDIGSLTSDMFRSHRLNTQVNKPGNSDSANGRHGQPGNLNMPRRHPETWATRRAIF